MSDRPEPLSGDLLTTLEREREGVAVPDGAEERILARVQATIAGGGTAGGSQSPANETTGPGPTARPPTGAFVLGLALGAAVSSLAWWALTPAPEAEVIIREVRVEVPTLAAVDGGRPVDLEDAGTLGESPLPSLAVEPRTETSEASTATRERTLLMRAQVALGRGLPADAVSALAEHRRRYPDGALREERDALWVQALAASADPRTSVAAREFVARYPESIFREGVEAAARGVEAREETAPSP